MSGDSNKKHTENKSRLDTTGEFFSVGSPLHAVRAGYIRRAADDLLYEAAVAGRYAHIIAPDRSGKSSLIAATSARLENNGAAVAILDLAQIGVRDGTKDAGRWYYSVAYRLLRQLRVRFDLQSWWQDKSVLGNRQRLLEFYSEVILQNVQKPVVVFVDEIQVMADLPFADQLLASIRAAHNARTTDPDFTRLTFILVGECDPISLADEAELSPFNVTQSISLGDFSREDLDLFATELNLSSDDAGIALDRVYYWTSGQPYLSQKLARAISRENLSGDIAGRVDRIVAHQLAGRAALHSEPHMSHIHREVVTHSKNSEALLNLYGRVRIGVDILADLGSDTQRRLMAVGLLSADDAGKLRIRNRIYESVFTARWANENLTIHWKTPAMLAAALVLVTVIPLWYTQWLPNAYIEALTSPKVELANAETAWRSYRSFPGHSATADDLFRNFLIGRVDSSGDVDEVQSLAELALALPNAGPLPQMLQASFWDRRVDTAMREERRDAALFASLKSLAMTTPQRRNRSAMLVGDDYPLLLASLPGGDSREFVFNPENLLLTSTQAALVSQWSLTQQGLAQRDDWSITALEVSPLVRRVIVDQQGSVQRIGLTLRVSHPRLDDLRVKVIAPSGRAIEVDLGLERSSSNNEIRIPFEQLRSLIGESISGTWSVSFRDETIGVAGHLVAWDLRLNSQVLVEDFQRGMSIPDPLERETENIWIDENGRYAVARATQSDSARIWDLAFTKPIAAIAVSESERIIGIDAAARTLATATLETVHLWDTASGRLLARLPVGPASQTSKLTRDGTRVFVTYRSDAETRFELWNLETAKKDRELLIAGAPALVALDASGERLAIADYDRAVRIWDVDSGDLVAQMDLPMQPSSIELSAGGQTFGAVYGNSGVAMWNVDEPQTPLLERFGDGRWQFRFSQSGARVLAGRARSGYQMYLAENGRPLGPPIGIAVDASIPGPLAFAKDEAIVVTGGDEGIVRFWQMPVTSAATIEDGGDQVLDVWDRSGESVVSALPDGSALVFGDREGHVHLVPSGVVPGSTDLDSEEVHFLGHNDVVRRLAVSEDSSRVASVAADNTIRVWESGAGTPNSFIINISGSSIDRIAFSANAKLIGILAGQQAAIIDASSGEILSEYDLGARQSAMVFGEGDALYVGGDNGALNIVARDGAGNWSIQRLWMGGAAIRHLAASPRGRYLVIVDGNNETQQFDLLEGRPGELTLSFPTQIEEVAFSPNGSRVLFRSSRWVHRVGSSPSGLIWVGASFVPEATSNARIRFPEPRDSLSQSGATFALIVARDGVVQLENFRFGNTQGPGLFGNKDALISEWATKLGRSP